MCGVEMWKLDNSVEREKIIRGRTREVEREEEEEEEEEGGEGRRREEEEEGGGGGERRRGRGEGMRGRKGGK